MREAIVYVHKHPAGRLIEQSQRHYRFEYLPEYAGPPVSLSMPIEAGPFEFGGFPPFFDGLLPEGTMLEGLLRQRKLDAKDYFGQLIAVGRDLVGAITVEAVT